MWSTLKYSFSLLLLLLSTSTFAQSDSTDNTQVPADNVHQLRIGMDISSPIITAFLETRNNYEFFVDYYWKKDFYWVVEGGWGGGTYSDTNLSYSSNNVFGRVGFNKSLLKRQDNKDWDIAFIGLRYGLGLIKRSDANYTVVDDFWGKQSGMIPGTNLTAHWIELTGGMNVEIYKQLFIGWNVRGKFLLNPKQFAELPPYYIAGFGRGEKNTIFDFNVYLSYALRWSK